MSTYRAPNYRGSQSVRGRGNGLPEPMKSRIEGMSGISMDGVEVHRSSPEPAKLGALAHAQGNQIHLGPGQEKHLAHEAWHVVQQAQGRVRPTSKHGSTLLNDDPGLEREADSMGRRAATSRIGPGAEISSLRPDQPENESARNRPLRSPDSQPIQRKLPLVGPPETWEGIERAIEASDLFSKPWTTGQIHWRNPETGVTVNVGQGIPSQNGAVMDELAAEIAFDADEVKWYLQPGPENIWAPAAGFDIDHIYPKDFIRSDMESIADRIADENEPNLPEKSVLGYYGIEVGAKTIEPIEERGDAHGKEVVPSQAANILYYHDMENLVLKLSKHNASKGNRGLPDFLKSSHEGDGEEDGPEHEDPPKKAKGRKQKKKKLPTKTREEKKIEKAEAKLNMARERAGLLLDEEDNVTELEAFQEKAKQVPKSAKVEIVLLKSFLEQLRSFRSSFDEDNIQDGIESFFDGARKSAVDAFIQQWGIETEEEEAEPEPMSTDDKKRDASSDSDQSEMPRTKVRRKEMDTDIGAAS